MKDFTVSSPGPDVLEVKARRPFISGFLIGLLVIAFGCFILLYKLFASPEGFFRAPQDMHQWLFWMFGILFCCMGLFVIVGSFRNLFYPLKCKLDRVNDRLSIWPVPFHEKHRLSIPLSSLESFEVVESLQAWMEQFEYFKQNPQFQETSWMKRWPQFMSFAHLKIEEAKLRRLNPQDAPKEMVPVDDPANERNTPPRVLLRLRMKTQEPVLLDWLGTFEREEVEELGRRLNDFLGYKPLP